MFGLEKIVKKVEIPPAEIDADLAVPIFGNPALKEDLLKKIKDLNNPLFSEIKIVSNYINIKLDIEKLAPITLESVLGGGDDYGFNDDGAAQTILIEYSSPNIAKPMHIGHLRNTAIGHALTKIYQANGYKVITANYIGDWGMPYAKVILAYQKWGDDQEFAKRPVLYLAELYTRITEEAAANPQLDEEARAIFKKMEDGDKELLSLWEKFRNVSIRYFQEIYKILGVDFDLWQGESFYQKFVEETIKEALDKAIARKESDGPIVVNLDQFKLPSFLLAKSDGASLYGARDLAAAKWRLKNYHPEKIIHVVGHEQELYFKQIFATLGLMGYPQERFSQVSYGLVTMDGKKLSTRAGHVVYLEDLLEETIKEAKGIKEVGIGAVIYSMLSQGKEKDVSFSWENTLNIHGNSAPYIQYGYVRAKSVLEKSPTSSQDVKSIFTSCDDVNIGKTEAKLIKQMAFYPETVRQAKELNAPHIITNFLQNFVQEFNRFYAESPILNTEANVKDFRLALTAASAQVIKNGLALLNIKTPNRM